MLHGTVYKLWIDWAILSDRERYREREEIQRKRRRKEMFADTHTHTHTHTHKHKHSLISTMHNINYTYDANKDLLNH